MLIILYSKIKKFDGKSNETMADGKRKKTIPT